MLHTKKQINKITNVVALWAVAIQAQLHQDVLIRTAAKPDGTLDKYAIGYN